MKILVILILLVGCGTDRGARIMKDADTSASQETHSLGMATMHANGTIKLTMYVDAEGRDAYQVIEYKPGEKYYDSILKHLGGLNPGQEKPVPPWPSTTP